MSNFEIAGTQLRIGDTTIEFRHEIANVIEHSECLIVRLDPPGGVTDKTNIIGIDYHGNKMWEIEEPEGQNFRESFFKSMQKQPTM
jgi:hypothetical protein